jgi:hypothetical protein
MPYMGNRLLSSLPHPVDPYPPLLEDKESLVFLPWPGENLPRLEIAVRVSLGEFLQLLLRKRLQAVYRGE